MELKSIHFIDEPIEIGFKESPVMEKKPGCPNLFIWNGQFYTITEMLEEWSDFTRRGKYARNMAPGHAVTASRRGSWGVGRFFFRVRVEDGRIFDLYYDRAPKDADDRKGHWFLYRELE